MPELPEVEVSCRGIRPFLMGHRIDAVMIRNPRLRQPIPVDLAEHLLGHEVQAIWRRGKYIVLAIGLPAGPCLGHVLLHLGMSGNLRVVPAGDPWRKHDHFALQVGQDMIRLHDPRRFGLVLWHSGSDVENHPLLQVLGLEPFDERFDGAWLQAMCRGRTQAIKPLLMDSHRLVGVGNIYAAESLFAAGISPKRAAGRLSLSRYEQLAIAIRATLQRAIDAGGSTLRDYLHSDGGAGSFQIQCQVYDRAGQACLRCGGTVRQIRQAGRSTFYCPGCQF